jgi:hypothetical protein
VIAIAHRHTAKLTAILVCGGLTIAIVAPLVRSGTLILLDYGTYPAGPNPQLDTSVWGFPPGLVTRAPVDVVLYAVFRALDWGWLRLLPFVVLAPLAWVGFRRLLGTRTLAVAAATVVFVVNPWTDDRLSAGQVYLAAGYALLPLLTSMLFRRTARPLTHMVLTGLLVALLIALAPHFIFIAGLLVIVALAVHLASREWQRAKEIGGALVAVGAVSVYWLIPALLFHPESLPVTNSDLSAFQTTSDGRYGLGLNVLGLYGFWRPGNPLAKASISGWPFLLLAILVLAGLGGWFAWIRLHARSLVIALGVSAVLAYFLALGNQGPTGGLFTLLYDHVPGFAIMREPEKFSAVLALTYATFFGLGVSCLAGLVRRAMQRRFAIAVAIAIPCVYGFTTFWGFDGYAAPSTYPASWAQADGIMGTGDQAVLALPWHLYLAFPWTQGRTVVNPMASYFQRPVISGDNIEAGDIETESTDPRSEYLTYLFSVGSDTTHLGRLLAPLGIRYVLLAKTDDWKDYSFLDTQADIRVVKNWGDLTLFENTEPAPLATAPTTSITVDTWGDVVGLAQETSLADYYVVVRNPGPGPIREPALGAVASPGAAPAAKVNSPVQVTLRNASAAPYLVVSEPFDPDWSANGQHASEELGALTGFTNVPPGAISMTYGRWPAVRDSYVASGAVLLILFGLIVIPSYRRRRNVSDPSSLEVFNTHVGAFSEPAAVPAHR